MLTSDPEVPARDVGETSTRRADRARRPSRHPVARVIGAMGRLMITSGVVLLLLVAYLLWGTNIQTSRSQGELADEFSALQQETDAAPTTSAPPTTGSATPTTAPPATPPPQVAPTIAPPALGDAIGSYRIPAIGLTSEQWTVEGTGTAQLKRGSAHYPGTPLPGQAGNAAVAGHRTTYGAPLKDVDDLVPGDQIFFTTLQGEFTYEVIGSEIVRPDDVSVLEDKGDDRLTLTACHPEFSARERIIISARLVGTPVEELEGQEAAADVALEASRGSTGSRDTIDVFATEPALTFPGAWWGLLCMALWGLVRLLAYVGHRTRRFPRFVPYLLGTPVCLLVLYLFFESVSYEGVVRSLGLSV